MRALSSAASLDRPWRRDRPGYALAERAPVPAGAEGAPAGPLDAQAQGGSEPRLESLLARARARMERLLAEGGEARAAAAHDDRAISDLPDGGAPAGSPAPGSHRPADALRERGTQPPSATRPEPGARSAPGTGLGWTYAADAGDGIRASAWSDRLARARARAAAAGASPDAGALGRADAGASGGAPGNAGTGAHGREGASAAGDPRAGAQGSRSPGPIRLAARVAAVVIGPDFGDDVFDVSPGQSLAFAFAAPPAAGLAAVEIAADGDAMRLALAGGPTLRLRGLDLSGRVTLSMGEEEIVLSPGARPLAIDARI
ncbi:hypothetical protein [uncultured Albimonas sp.]|uniref:hypothetical protein n=1 Tax=uncultured Albimonas sp. TaxID=1331701 RepID=UPI0030EC3E04